VGGIIGGTAQYHLLTYLGEFWGRGDPRFAPDFVGAATRHVNAQGGVMTWDVPISSDGAIPASVLRCLGSMPAEGEGPSAPSVRESPDPTTESPAGPDRPSSRAQPTAGTRTVEPRYIRLLRSTAHQTQAQFAAALGVHVRTVVGWECSEQPARIRASTFERLTALATRLELI
jgi:hypothetical protein